MKFRISTWIREKYNQTINSIAFYPIIIVVLFLIASYFSIHFDFSEQGRIIKSRFTWLRLQDASTARSIITVIAAGVLSLTVFSFSMVMIVLNQTASQMSNRMLDRLIGSKFQQVVLGAYVGTIVYGLFLLSTIRNVDSGIHIPALSTYLLIALTICDIFLFIYFLHYITQSVKYEVIIRRIYDDTCRSMLVSCTEDLPENVPPDFSGNTIVLSPHAGVYEGFDRGEMIALCDRENCVVFFHHSPGTFVLKGVPVATVDVQVSRESLDEMQSLLLIHASETIAGNFMYGFRQLTEVALKALSPGVNDPGTAIQAIRALFELYSFRICHSPASLTRNAGGTTRAIQHHLLFDECFKSTLRPIWDYGKRDRMLQTELRTLLKQMPTSPSAPCISELLTEVELQMMATDER